MFPTRSPIGVNSVICYLSLCPKSIFFLSSRFSAILTHLFKNVSDKQRQARLLPECKTFPGLIPDYWKSLTPTANLNCKCPTPTTCPAAVPLPRILYWLCLPAFSLMDVLERVDIEIFLHYKLPSLFLSCSLQLTYNIDFFGGK